jgi:hypothetical protein
MGGSHMLHTRVIVRNVKTFGNLSEVARVVVVLRADGAVVHQADVSAQTLADVRALPPNGTLRLALPFVDTKVNTTHSRTRHTPSLHGHTHTRARARTHTHTHTHTHTNTHTRARARALIFSYTCQA